MASTPQACSRDYVTAPVGLTHHPSVLKRLNQWLAHCHFVGEPSATDRATLHMLQTVRSSLFNSPHFVHSQLGFLFAAAIRSSSSAFSLAAAAMAASCASYSSLERTVIRMPYSLPPSWDGSCLRFQTCCVSVVAVTKECFPEILSTEVSDLARLGLPSRSEALGDTRSEAVRLFTILSAVLRASS